MLEKRTEMTNRDVLDKIQLLLIESGAVLFKGYPYTLNRLHKSVMGVFELDFDFGVPLHFYTPEGSYDIGVAEVGDTKKFWEFLLQHFDVGIINPKKDMEACSRLEYQTEYSGPYVKIRKRKS